ncbi:MAG: UbiA family prenyltransferase [Haloquadratum sp.]|nr:UbiA family prenyltransferase [Haloquadratum sp.]
MGGFLLLAWQYSAPPGRFKTTVVADSVSNGLYILPGVAVYAQLSGALPPAAAIVGAWLWSMAMHTYSAIPDIGPDRTAGITTTATWLGRRRTLWYCGVVWTLAAATFAIVDPRWGALMLLYPLLLVVWDRQGIPDRACVLVLPVDQHGRRCGDRQRRPVGAAVWVSTACRRCGAGWMRSSSRTASRSPCSSRSTASCCFWRVRRGCCRGG